MDSYTSKSKLTFGNGKAKILAIVLALVVLIAIGFIIATIILGVKYTNKGDFTTSSIMDTPTTEKYHKNETETNETLSICNTEECVKAAGDILKSLDKNVNPCEDFYQFSCGNWVKNNPIPDSMSSWDAYNELPGQVLRRIRDILETKINASEPVPLQYAKVYYKSCVDQNVTDQAELKELLDVVLKVGDVSKNIGLKLGELRRRIMRQFLFSFYIDVDLANSSNFVFYLDQPSLGLDRDFLLDVGHPNRKLYKDFIATVWPLVYPDEPSTDAALIAEKIIDFESKIAEIVTPGMSRNYEVGKYNVMSLAQLADLTASKVAINWEVYVTELFRDVVQNHNVDLGYLPSLRVVVRDLNYFKNLSSILSVVNEEDPVTLANFLRWRIMIAFGNDVSSTLRNVFSDYLKKSEGVTSYARWAECCDKTNSAFGMAVSYAYVKEVFSGNFTAQATEMMLNMRNSILELIDQLDWIGHDDVRSTAKERVQKMISYVGYPEWLLGNKSALGIYYRQLEFNTSATYFENLLRTVRWRNMENLQSINKHRDDSVWLNDPTYIGAFYSPAHNALSIPAGYLQPPFYFTGKPIQALNYGAVGTVIGHEITHGLDLLIEQKYLQAQMPSNNDNVDALAWLEKKKTAIKYNIKADCFIDQYNKFVISESKNLTVDGVNTLGENIADNAGIRQSFRAYQSYVRKHGPEQKLPGMDYNPRQLFFLAYAQTFCGSYTQQALESKITADEHAPDPFRVKGVLANSFDFAETWNCPRPNSSNVCRIW